MALDGISATAGVLQVAEMGFSLAKSIHNFVLTAKDAPKDLRVVAQDIRLLSIVLKRAHTQIQSTDNLKQHEMDADFQDILDGTKDAFNDVRESVASMHSKGQTVARLQYAFNKKEKIELLGANLEKRKTTLLVMIGIVGLAANTTNAGANGDQEAMAVAKLEVQTMIRAKTDAEKKYEVLAAAFSQLQPKTESASQGMQGLSLVAMPRNPTNPAKSCQSGSDADTMHDLDLPRPLYAKRATSSGNHDLRETCRGIREHDFKQPYSMNAIKPSLPRLRDERAWRRASVDVQEQLRP
ncbi:hypothetical protein CLAFUW4_10223 [Fulvia fulva]|uniref:Fungal N-terminal domain-containing protein n=1 Tax=Passalora fulva TaxID=5499 RepID=A0A9Q8LE49_PASFU|nr:uncharacterized protein CLAFUR5_04837 [Fulvia fulva]KAK4615329.1 hypothetical protein CLAFUR4_10227 [Fulvia fulva]KAK4616952.1 hypothetical protein CLAFUR0_10225 [Fulvia fulva]UJO15815.1 hypothetical protein CLAFUR5_04837 [Fulvia fulva]WPV18747.1 hypothetical protein CLAFUW4_10223 [Fulvia fulva]WPV34079.1 hypothetical protein CLAFUW7_10223 [Fulvia fulva]